MFLQLYYFFYAPQSNFFEQHFYLFEHSKGSVKVCLTLEADVISDKIRWLRYLIWLSLMILQGLKIWISRFPQGWNEITSGFLARPDTSLDFVLTTFEGEVGMKSWQVPVVPDVPLAMYSPAIQPSVGSLSSQPYCYGEGDTQPRTDCWSKIQTEDCRPEDVHQFLNRKEMETTCTPHGKPSKLGLQADFEWTAIT